MKKRVSITRVLSQKNLSLGVKIEEKSKDRANLVPYGLMSISDISLDTQSLPCRRIHEPLKQNARLEPVLFSGSIEPKPFRKRTEKSAFGSSKESK